MKINVYNQEGKETGQITLPKEIFDVEFNSDLVHQVVISLLANKRQISAHTKNRAEVRGGGKKPWRQKGTGRARHGSIRSPLWKGGGVTHGPRKERIFERELPKKMRRKALFMVLSQKVKDKQLVILDKVELAGVQNGCGKTKEMAGIMQKLPCKNENTLITMPDYDKKIFLASRNIKNISVEEARNLNALQLMNHKYLLMTKDSVKIIEKTFAK